MMSGFHASYRASRKGKNYLWRDYKGCPGHQDEQTRGQIVDDQILGVVTADEDVKPGEGEVTKLSVIVEEQSETYRLYRTYRTQHTPLTD